MEQEQLQPPRSSGADHSLAGPGAGPGVSPATRDGSRPEPALLHVTITARVTGELCLGWEQVLTNLSQKQGPQ